MQHEWRLAAVETLVGTCPIVDLEHGRQVIGASCVLRGEVPDGASCTITARDEFENVQATSAEAGSLAVSLSGTASPAAAVSGTAHGQYTVTYNATVAGVYSIAVTFNSAAVGSSPRDMAWLRRRTR